MSARVTLVGLALLAGCRKDATGPVPAAPGLPVARVTVSPPALALTVGDTFRISVYLQDANNHVVLARPVVFASSNPAVATVSTTGLVTALGVDSCTVRATSEGVGGEARIAVVPVPPPEHAFLWTAAGGFTDLGVLPGFTTSYALALNAGGQVVGASRSGEGATSRTHAVLWSPAGVVQDLGTLPGGDRSSAAAINSLGQVVGEASVNGTNHAVLWSPTGRIRDLGTLPGDVSSTATGINDAGQVVGTSYPPRGAPRVVIWTEQGGMVERLGSVAYGGAIALGINRSGAVAGQTNFERAFRLNERLVFELLQPRAGDRYSAAYAINDAGDVAGSSSVCPPPSGCGADDDPVPRAMLWTGSGAIVDLNALPGFYPPNSEARALNNRGQVVGQSGSRAFLWSQAGGFTDIGVLPLRRGSIAVAVNDAGQVVGSSW